MSAPKHHYVPRYLLREFSIDGQRRQVFVFDKKSGRIFPAAIDDVGCERNFNVVRSSGEGVEVVFEPVFDDIDRLGAALIRKIIETRRPDSLDQLERLQLTKVLAAQIVRVKLYRDGIVDFTEKLSRSVARAGLEPGEITNVRELTANDAARISLRQMLEIDELAQHLCQKHCILHTFQSETIWSSDNPLVMFNAFPYGDRALQSPGVEIHLPISSELVLSFYCPSIARRTQVLLASRHAGSPAQDWFCRFYEGMITGEPVDSREHATFFNEFQVAYASRFLFAASRQFDAAQRFLVKNPGARQNTSTIAVGEMGTLPRRNNFPPGLHLVVIVNTVDHFMVRLSEWREGEEGVEFTFRCEHSADAEFLARQGPYETAGVFDNGCEIRHVREALVEIGQDGWASVCHRDPTLRTLTARIRARP